ncbi:hypothetical protein GcC1_065032 [Golovinomyces cichoracearum]|uniref:Uncharacterized protein n=1 Tax=Golovinomyces cichoracearum TaxID=62708 RepID=A0A420IRV7_9PEZI|nr:hypothetical protein GcC1_065032 [Golovinomyces cichoracearum]
MHRLIKTYFGYGFGHFFRLYQCVNVAIKVTSRKYQEELGEQKMAVQAQYGGFKWMDKLPRRIAKKALRLLNNEAITKDDINSFYWLDKVTSAGDRALDVLLDNPLLDVGEAKKVVNSKGRP